MAKIGAEYWGVRMVQVLLSLCMMLWSCSPLDGPHDLEKFHKENSVAFNRLAHIFTSAPIYSYDAYSDGGFHIDPSLAAAEERSFDHLARSLDIYGLSAGLRGGRPTMIEIRFGPPRLGGKLRPYLQYREEGFSDAEDGFPHDPRWRAVLQP